jgi:hypothetical protein
MTQIETLMTSIEIHKIAQLYDLKMNLTNGMKNYTFDKAREFAVKFCDKNFSTHECDLVKTLMSKKILAPIEPRLYDVDVDFVAQHYSDNVFKFITLSNTNEWSVAYNCLETLDDWIIVYQLISFVRFYEIINKCGLSKF